jgi:hypothetical protein
VFKEGLTFRDGMFRTPYINPAFEHNVLSLKQKGLLVVEQPSKDFNSISSCGELGIRTPGTFNSSTVFKTAAIDHSASSPGSKVQNHAELPNWILYFF